MAENTSRFPIPHAPNTLDSLSGAERLVAPEHIVTWNPEVEKSSEAGAVSHAIDKAFRDHTQATEKAAIGSHEFGPETPMGELIAAVTVASKSVARTREDYLNSHL